MRVLVCGGRSFQNKALLFKVLDDFHAAQPITDLIHGGADGADNLASLWAMGKPLQLRVFPAYWKLDGPKAAGPLRNQRMLDVGKPDMVIAFPGGTGTADMIRRTRAAKIPLFHISSEQIP
jgi:hypothetical protein